MQKTTVNSKYELCIIGGAGHVGLPLGIAFALKGVKTVLFDINQGALDTINLGIVPFKEKNGNNSLRRALNENNLFTSISPEVISQSRFVVLVVGTPIDEYFNPYVRGIFKVLDRYAEYFHDGHILILRSTVYPGTSEKIQRYFQEQGKAVQVAFCPERIVEGRALEELVSLPQIVSVFDQKIFKKVSGLFSKLTKRKIVAAKPIEAELAKLFSNAWRYIHFSIANQFFMIASSHGLDYHKIHQIMTKDYERNHGLPSPGFAAGPCLLKDTMQLAAFNNNNFFLGHSAMLINEGLPNFIMQKLIKDCPDIHNKNIGILGMAFKSESDDQRDSLSFKLRKLAETKCRQVFCHDFYIKSSDFYPLEQVLKKSDIVILAAPHKKYKTINLQKYKNIKFIDVWNFWQ